MKKLTVLLLTAALLLSLCACGTPDISGTWQGEVRLAALEQELAAHTNALEDFLEIPAMTGSVRFCFVEGEEENTYRYEVTLDEACRTALIEAVETASDAFVLDYYEAAAELLSLDMEGLRRMYKNQRMDLDEEMANDKASQLAELDIAAFVDAYVATCTGEGTWSIEDETLSLSEYDAPCGFALSGKQMTLTTPAETPWGESLVLSLEA